MQVVIAKVVQNGVKTLHQMTILIAPGRRAHWDTWNWVLVHPIQSPDDKVMPSGRLLDKSGWIWTQGGAERPHLTLGGLDLCPMATKLGPGPLHSPRSPWEALFITLDHMGVRKSPNKVTQSNISKDVSISRGRKFWFAPNFIPMRWRTIDEVNQLKINDKGLKATLGDGPRTLASGPFSPNCLIFGQHAH